MSITIHWACLLLVGMPFAASEAQAPVRIADASTVLRLRDTVQIRLMNPTGIRTTSTVCDGNVGALRGDTIYVTRSSACGPREIDRADVHSLRVQRGTSGSRVKHMANGVAIGGLLGGAAFALIAAGSTCSCDDDFPTVFAAGLGGAAGALAGGVIGLLVPAGPRWIQVANPPAIRIARYQIKPTLHISAVGGPH